MELAITKKIPWKKVKSSKKLEVVNTGYSSKDIIAIFNDDSEYIYLKDSNDEDLYTKIKNMSPEKIKQLIINGVIDKNDLTNLLHKNDDNYLSVDKQKFEYWQKDVMFMPTLNKERELLYIFGPSGSGKSYLTKNYAILYLKHKKGNDIFLLSHVKDDPSFAGLKYNHIPIDKELLDNTDLESFRDSLVIFDDSDCPKDKELQHSIDALKDDIAQRGRHYNISAIFTTHIACNFNRTRVLLSECDKFIIFPGAGGNKQQESMVVNYGGMPKSFFASLKSYKSRWVMFNVRYPNYIVYQNGVTILS